MTHLLTQLMNTKTREKDKIAELCEQYTSIQDIHKKILLSKVNTFDDVEDLINQVLDDLTVVRSNTKYNSEILKDMFLDISKMLECQELNELKNTMKIYTENTIVNYLNSPELINNQMATILEDYLDKLEKTFETLRYDEKAVVKRYYYLKVKLIDTFIWAGGLNYG